MFIKPSCKRSGHEVDKASITHVGGGLVGVCKRCGEALTRKVGGWQAVPNVPQDVYAGPERRSGPRGAYTDRGTK